MHLSPDQSNPLLCFHTRRGRSPAGVGTSRGDTASVNRAGGVHDEESWCMTDAVFRTPNSHEKMIEAAKVIGNDCCWFFLREYSNHRDLIIKPLDVEYVCDMAPSCIWHYLWNNCYVPFGSHPNFSFSCFPGHSGIQSFFESQPTNEQANYRGVWYNYTATPPTTTTLLVKHFHQIHNQIISEPYKIIVPCDKSVALYRFFPL